MLRRIAAILLSAALLSAVPLSAASPARADSPEEERAASLPFADVPADAWYYADVLYAYETGLVNGRSADTFAPDAELTLAEVIKLAACVRQLGEEGAVTLANGPDIWYSTYLEYCVGHDLLPHGNRWTAEAFVSPATRGETMAVFALAAEPEPVNEIPDGSIPDVSEDHPFAEGIYALYRAGVAQGSDELHRALPDTTVTRAEIAAIITRLTVPATRVRFSLEALPDFMEHPEPPAEPGIPDPAAPPAEEPAPDEGSGEQPGESGASGLLSADPREWSPLTLTWARNYEERFGEGSSDKLLLTPEEIAAYDARMIGQCPVMTDIASFPDQVSGDTVRALIGAYELPVGYDYGRDGTWIDEARRAGILENRALEAVPTLVTVQKAVITSRCSLRGQPTGEGFYSRGDVYYDQLQETELIVGTPAAVLHRSADGAYLFVQAYHYAGWIPVTAAAYCDAETFAFCADPTDFVTITAASVQIGAVTLDMGVTLRYAGEDADSYLAALPVRLQDGTCGRNIVPVPKSKSVRGWLPYTMKNVYEEAFSCLGVMYGWGGADGGLDCSGFVSAVLRPFGIRLPRNSAEQRVAGGEAVDLVYLSAADRMAVFAADPYPVAIFSQRHVMLYLGEEAGVPYIIHAYRGGDPVAVAALDPWSAMLCAVSLH